MVGIADAGRRVGFGHVLIAGEPVLYAKTLRQLILKATPQTRRDHLIKPFRLALFHSGPEALSCQNIKLEIV
jgi:hypothetical protein